METSVKTRLFKWLATPVVALTLSASAFADANRPIRIATSNWAETEAMVNIAKVVLEKKLNQKVELTLTDPGAQFQGVARGDLDLMMMGWLPVTHKEYYAKFKDQLDDMGILFTGARLGWAVPDYIPKSQLASFADLKRPEVKEKLQGRIQGIEPGGGLMITSEKALQTYGLNDYTLVSASETAMLAALKRADDQKQWIVITAWSPHWMFSKWRLRYLDDPSHAMGASEQIHAFSSKSFRKNFPKAAQFVQRMKMSALDLQTVMLEARSSSVQAAAENFVNTHGSLVQQWTKD